MCFCWSAILSAATPAPATGIACLLALPLSLCVYMYNIVMTRARGLLETMG